MKKTLALVVGFAFLAGGWYLFSPLFFDRELQEAFPVPGLTVEEKQVIKELESLTPEEVSEMPEELREGKERQMEELGKKMEDTVAREAPPRATEVEVIAQGSFRDADSFHRGSGTATIHRFPDGNHILRFENFSVTNGPALYVYLVKDASGDVGSGFLDLGKLKGNIGNQNYPIPADVDLSQFRSVVIWCRPFAVTFSVATLQE